MNGTEIFSTSMLNTLRPQRIGRHFADDIFKYIFLNEIVWIAIKISLKFVPKCPINNIPALVQIIAWRRPCDKPLSEPMKIKLMTHICVTRPQWVKVPYQTQQDLGTNLVSWINVPAYPVCCESILKQMDALKHIFLLDSRQLYNYIVEKRDVLYRQPMNSHQ